MSESEGEGLDLEKEGGAPNQGKQRRRRQRRRRDRGAKPYQPDVQSQFQQSVPHAPHGRPQPFGHASSPQENSFHRFANATRLPPDELAEWEHDLRQQLLDILEYLPGPLPLVEWINHRIGGEVETFQDDMGAVMIGLRSVNVHVSASAAGAPPPRVDHARPLHDLPQNATPKAEKKSMNFFGKLPVDSFNVSEVKLRNAILGFLASWTSHDKATLPDLANDEVVDKIKQQFVPKVVPLEEWIENRMGEEVLFRTDHLGRQLVDLTQSGLEAVQEKIDELSASKRKSEKDIHPTGGKKQRV